MAGLFALKNADKWVDKTPAAQVAKFSPAVQAVRKSNIPVGGAAGALSQKTGTSLLSS